MAGMTLLLVLVWLLASPQRAPIVPVGSVAPAFTVNDDRGSARSLADFKGKWIVLEWHEKGCPYVTKHYRSGHMQRLQKEWTDQGVTWLMVTSSAEGNHSYLTPDESRTYLADVKAAPTAHLLDVDGRIGRQYGVLTALHMVVIDPTGRVVYNDRRQAHDPRGGPCGSKKLRPSRLDGGARGPSSHARIDGAVRLLGPLFRDSGPVTVSPRLCFGHGACRPNRAART